jgi:enoyl-CoA hydratase/carnithine racemase
MTNLFTIPISTGGTFECTSPSKDIYLLSFSSPPDNRVTAPLLSAFHLSLDILEQRYPKGVVITTSAIPKFFSNGFDLEHVRTTHGFYEDALFPLLRRLFT